MSWAFVLYVGSWVSGLTTWILRSSAVEQQMIRLWWPGHLDAGVRIPSQASMTTQAFTHLYRVIARGGYKWLEASISYAWFLQISRRLYRDRAIFPMVLVHGELFGS